ncbi:MAG: PHP domain-containing protein [Candidatus Thermoplasmatota archaeon]|nr:PHP domain-containing protein [Candidatus Thermoplasmatota archaeon]
MAAQYAESLTAFLRAVPGVEQVTVAGSFRRMRETVGDLDILVTATANSPVMRRFTAYDEVAEILSAGSTRASVVLKSGLQVDLRVMAQQSYGAALHYFTGSKAHNIAIRRIAQKLGLKVNEYGVFRGTERIAGEDEASVYQSVGLPYIPPELREDRGEIEAARANRLPNLVVFADLRGDLHAHTRATDGHDSLRDMALAAKALGLEYLAITEHSRHLTVAHGLDPLRLARQCEEIDRLNMELEGITLLKGIEVDILEDGSLDLPDDALGRLDLVVGAVHSQFHLSRAKQTGRILRAMDHPHFTMLAHPSGRLIDRREPYDVDMLRIIRHAKERGCFLELNAHPERLDLLDSQCQTAKEEGVLVSINSDAHSSFDFSNLKYGVGQARRGWLEKDDALGRLDLVVGAVHSQFHLSRAKQTGRILRAMDHPHFTMLAHPSGRLIDRREPYDVDMLRIIRHAKERGCFLELNAHPERLDLLDSQCQTAKEEGVLVSINSDAHSSFDFSNLKYGVGQARRGWLEKDDVLNTRPLATLRRLLRRTM